MDKLDFSKPDQLQTRDGRAVRIYATDCGGAYPIHGAVQFGEVWALLKWTIDGRHCNSVYESPYDLVPKPVRVTGWVNVYARRIYVSREKAKEMATYNCLGQIYIDAEVQE